jgi:hypothetical protein
MNRLRFAPNVPQIIALQDPEGDYKPDQEEVEYLLTDGRILVLNVPDATRLNLMDLQTGETFSVCKRLTEGQLPYIEIALSNATEKARAAQEQESPPIPVPRRKRGGKVHEIPVTQGPSVSIHVPPLPIAARGTGTYGPAPQTQPTPASRPQSIPLNQAFVEAVKIVRDGLKEAGVQWGDGPQQDAVSTLLIGALNRNWIGPWERTNA